MQSNVQLPLNVQSQHSPLLFARVRALRALRCALCLSALGLSRGGRGAILVGVRAIAFDEVCPQQLLDAPFDWEEPQLEGIDPRLILPGVQGRLATPVMDPRTLGHVQGMSIAQQWD